MDVDSYIEEIGKNIVRFRKIRGMTQVELANFMGSEDSALRRIEKGKTNPTIKTLYKICEVLQVDIKDILPEKPGIQDAPSKD